MWERLAPAGHRRLLFNPYAGLVWLGLSEASRLRRVQQTLGGPRASLGSLSESVRVFDPQWLEPIFRELFAPLPRQTASESTAGMTSAGNQHVGNWLDG